MGGNSEKHSLIGGVHHWASTTAQLLPLPTPVSLCLPLALIPTNILSAKLCPTVGLIETQFVTQAKGSLPLQRMLQGDSFFTTGLTMLQSWQPEAAVIYLFTTERFILRFIVSG